MKKRRPDLVSPTERLRLGLLRRVSQFFERIPIKVRFAGLFLLFVFAATALLDMNLTRVATAEYREGDIARRTVVAPDDFTAPDVIETDRKRRAARTATPPIFIFDESVVESSIQDLRTQWKSWEDQTAKPGSNNTSVAWPVPGGAEAAAVLVQRGLNHRDLESLERLLERPPDEYVFNDSDAAHLSTKLVLISKGAPGMRHEIDQLTTALRPLSSVRRNLQEQITRLPGWTAAEVNAVFPALSSLVRPSLVYDPVTTESAIRLAEAAIAPAFISLKRNQLLIREGEIVTTQTLPQLAAVNEYERKKRPWHHLAGLLAIVAALFWIAWKFVEHRSAAVSLQMTPRRVYALVGSAIVMQTLFMRFGFTIADLTAAQSTRFPLTDPSIWGYGIPMAAAALLVALLVDSKLAFLTGLVTALFAGLLASNGIHMTFYAIISSSVAIYGIGRYRDRQSVTIAGLLVGVINALMAIAIVAFEQRPLNLRTVLWCMLFGIIGGLLTSVFTAGGLPINESVFGILTDVKLLELSNADLPVLGQMALRAPGTNQHSHAVGQLCEEACRAIGANSLLARIGALYHDIGKLGAPEYFVENQHGHNPHDKLRPSNSARIITSHVTYGLKLAKEIGLPQKIADFIPQHHGTRTLHFFLRKAQVAARPGEVVDEADFRYLGPKPQFKEAAIMMIADSCEAGARSLAHPDPENVSLIVNKIVDAIVTDGQLNECDLNLRELTLIRESMVSSLAAIYHARVDYPGFNPPSQDSLRVVPDGTLDTEERGISYRTAAEVPINASGEVEDEAVVRDVPAEPRPVRSKVK
ncbi:MAG: HDIG domain-containing metalloprotein [Pyrinomonadaceae bacterium]